MYLVFLYIFCWLEGGSKPGLPRQGRSSRGHCFLNLFQFCRCKGDFTCSKVATSASWALRASPLIVIIPLGPDVFNCK